jgi:hypothetical protein
MGGLMRGVAMTLAVHALGCARDAGPPRREAATRGAVADANGAATAAPDSAGRTANEASLAPNEASLAPLWGSEPIVPLDVPGFGAAVISLPIGATGPRPVVVATHGLWDLPEGLCDDWRWIVRDRAWVICPRGDAMPDKTFRYKSGPALAREIDAGLAALAARYPGYVDPGPMLYTGFSLGAILGAWIVAHDPARYPRAVLIEGGEDRFTAESAARFARGGGQRVLFACGLRARVPAAERAAKLLERAGVPSRVVLGQAPRRGRVHPLVQRTRRRRDEGRAPVASRGRRAVVTRPRAHRASPVTRRHAGRVDRRLHQAATCGCASIAAVSRATSSIETTGAVETSASVKESPAR